MRQIAGQGEIAHPREEIADVVVFSRRPCRRAFGFCAAFSRRRRKPFQDQRLADSAVTLEAQIKEDAGKPAKPLAQIRRDADAAFTKNDFRGGMALLGQIVAAAPNDSATWLRLARTVMQIRPADDNEKNLLLERASTAAYIAYQRTTNRTEEADSLAFLGNVMGQREQWRAALDALRLSLEMREVADVRGLYEKMRDEHGFRVLDYSVDFDTASPRACFQFSENLPRRTDFSPFVVLAGTDKPALSAVEKQLCVEGLQHGETYTVTLRAGLPSTVHETLSKSADFSIYVRDRKPAVHFSSTAYVLPEPASGAFPLSPPTPGPSPWKSSALAIAISPTRSAVRIPTAAIFKEASAATKSISCGTRAASRFGRASLRSSRRPSTLTSPPPFPFDQAIGDVAPGVYVMVAQPQETKHLDNNFDSLATQWFIVSDLGLTAFSGNDGIHVFVNSLASAQGKTGIEVRLISRSNEVLATRRTDAAGHAHSRRRWRAARAQPHPPW